MVSCCGADSSQRTSQGGEVKCYESKYCKFAVGVILAAAITLFAMAAWMPGSFAGTLADSIGYEGALAAFIVCVGIAGVAVLHCAYKVAKGSEQASN